jgi:hypothetical protein
MHQAEAAAIPFRQPDRKLQSGEGSWRKVHRHQDPLPGDARGIAEFRSFNYNRTFWSRIHNPVSKFLVCGLYSHVIVFAFNFAGACDKPMAILLQLSYKVSFLDADFFAG